MPVRQNPNSIGPQIAAIPFRARSRGRALPLLAASDKAELTAIGTLVRMDKGVTLYRAAAPADSVYNVVQGVAKTFRDLPDTRRHVSAFAYSGDIVGLAEQGRYLESAEAVVPVAAYKIPLGAFETLLSRNGSLAMRMLCKAADDLRRKHHHALILDRQDAVGKIAMFLVTLEDVGLARGPGGSIYFPMTRSDVADYVGLTLEAVSRAVHALEDRRVVRFVSLHHFHVIDRARLEALSAGSTALSAPRPKSAKKAPSMPVVQKKQAS
jgi:CRP-like cAMP-binding protein